MRNSSIESLRILLIIFILGFHFISYGVFHPQHPITLTSPLIIPVTILESIFVIAVNCFVLISGYFGINNIISKLSRLYTQVLFYSISISSIYFAWQLYMGNDINYYQLLYSFIPVISKRWWFFTAYIILMLFSPILNMTLNNYSKRYTELFIIIGIVLFIICPTIKFPIIEDRGFGFISFMLLYLLGGYIRRYSTLSYSTKFYLILYVISFLLISIHALILFFFGKNYGYRSSSFAYNNILVFVSSIFFFVIFLKLKIPPSKPINRIATFVFGIYLFHEHPVIKDLLFDTLYSDSTYYQEHFFSSILLVCLTLFISGCILDYIRQRIFSTRITMYIQLKVVEIKNQILKLKSCNI